jgi:ribosomal protein S18 acetylase RimI-like enzyme
MTVRHFDASKVDDVTDVLAEAFYNYPVMRFAIGPDHADYANRLRKLVGFFVYRRARVGAPLLGIEAGGRLVAAAAITLPAGPDPMLDPDVVARRDQLWRDLGDAARGRYDRYGMAIRTFFATLPPHHHLNMIGVRPARAGQGLGRKLLDAVADLSRADPGSAGVTLTTETASNVKLYEHVGYKVIAEATVEPDMTSWGLFLRQRPGGVQPRTTRNSEGDSAVASKTIRKRPSGPTSNDAAPVASLNICVAGAS